MDTRELELEIEADITWSDVDEPEVGYEWVGTGDLQGMRIAVKGAGGHGFGLTEVLTVTIAVASGVTANAITEGVKAAVRGVIRRARARHRDASDDDGPRQELIEAVQEALRLHEESNKD